MRKVLLGLTVGILLGVLPAAAQRPSPIGAGATSSAPRLEVSLGYSYVRGKTRFVGCCFSMNGGSLSAAYNLNDWLGVVGDFGGYYTRNVNKTAFSLSMITYTFGPRYTIRKSERFTPYVQTLFGGVHGG